MRSAYWARSTCSRRWGSSSARPSPAWAGVDMTKGRLEAFTDGAIAVMITIMALEMKVPHGADPGAVGPLVPGFLSFLLSFLFTGIYVNNRHHMCHPCP